MKILDLFCGVGGWSKGFAEAGHECTGVDIKNLGYPYRFIKADLFDWQPDQQYDVVLASPPCTHFSQVVLNWTGKSNPTKGLDLVWRTYDLILNVIKPQYYAIENVAGLASFIGPPSMIVPYGKNPHSKQAYVWSNAKAKKITINRTLTRKSFRRSDPKLAEIPIQLSRAYARSMS